MKTGTSITDMEMYFSNFSFNNAVPTFGRYESYLRIICSLDYEDILVSMLSYLEYNEILSLSMTCKTIKRRLDKKVIKRYVRNGCISNKTRRYFWINNINYKRMEDLIRRELENKNKDDNLYKKILQLAEEERGKDNKKFFRIVEEINRDLERTFYIGKFITVEGQEELGRVLTALAYVRPEIGYCQGMNFIAGALLNFLNEEEIAFWAFLALIDDHELNSLYFQNMPDYSIRVYQLNFYIKKFIPELFYHFKKNQINPDIFFSKWILTIFSSYLPFETLAKVWDIFLIDKWKAIFKFSLAFLKEMHSTLIKHDMNGTSKYFRDNYRNLHLDCKLVLGNYALFKITNSELVSLREEFFLEQVKKKLEDLSSTWEADQEEPLMIYKKQLDEYEKKAKPEITFYKQRIDQLHKEFQSCDASYSNQLKKCTELKIKIEELIESKTAYENVLNILSSSIKANDNGNGNIKPPKQNVIETFTITKGKNNLQSAKTVNGTGKKVMGRSSSCKTLSVTETSKIEYKKISKKLQIVNKELERVNKSMLNNFKLLDDKKYYLEKISNEKLQVKQLLEKVLLESEIKHNELIKNLSERLKLSEKFVKTSTF